MIVISAILGYWVCDRECTYDWLNKEKKKRHLKYLVYHSVNEKWHMKSENWMFGIQWMNYTELLNDNKRIKHSGITM